MNADCCRWESFTSGKFPLCLKFPWPKSMASCTKELFEVAALICIDTLAEDAAQEDDGMVLIVLKRLRCQPSGRATRKESLAH